MSQVCLLNEIALAKADLLDDFEALTARNPDTNNTMAWPKPFWQMGTSSLYRFSNSSEPSSPRKPILLLCFALIYDPQILHIAKSASFIESLTEQGFDVFMLDWGSSNASADIDRAFSNPESKKAKSTTLQLLEQSLLPAVQAIRTQTNSLLPIKNIPIHIMGVCQGAFLTTLACALWPHLFASSTIMVAPCDTQQPGDEFANMIRATHPILVQSSEMTIDGQIIGEFFMSLRPVTLKIRKLSGMRKKIEDDKFLAIENWLRSGPAVCRQFLLEYISNVYLANGLYENKIDLGGRLVDLKQISCPVFNIVARRDTIVRESSSRSFKQLFSHTRYQEMTINCGHIGAFIKPDIQQALAEALLEFCKLNNKTTKEEAL